MQGCAVTGTPLADEEEETLPCCRCFWGSSGEADTPLGVWAHQAEPSSVGPSGLPLWSPTFLPRPVQHVGVCLVDHHV